ncbi:MAG: cryptochrome/photolyase family protein [Ignavibacteriales bacterium]|nr:cryptochrome/photolyase family protein [Ignavibacteriales bacterium]
MKQITLMFPHQLFEDHPAIEKGRDVVIIEDPLFFGDHKYPLNFHKMKLTLHRASMKEYAGFLSTQNHKVHYLDYENFKKDNNYLFTWLKNNNYQEIHYSEVDDFILNKRLNIGSEKNKIAQVKYYNPQFLNTESYIRDCYSEKKNYFQHSFYVDQRKKFNILVDGDKPIDGKWSFDSENRKSIPNDLKIPKLLNAGNNENIISEAQKYVNENFSNNPGENSNFYIPTNFNSAKNWLDDFLENKFELYGTYQDAIVRDESFLYHSLLSPIMNVGLLTPDYILERTLEFVAENEIPINSVEGFVRQIIGWREFIRSVYMIDGVKQRNSNFFKNKNKLPKSFYNGTTGIEPIDQTIKKLLKTGYNHHIERLMILGNFMLLCEIEPNEIYNWFMEMYIDSYDWVMVPNVYGMSQFADGGLMSTKPYISSSNYVRKMSDYKNGEWTKIWDGLFWRFVQNHYEYFASNNRTIMMIKNLERMSKSSINEKLHYAESFISSF